MCFFDIIVNLIIQKLKSQHTSLKNTQTEQNLYIFLSFWENDMSKKNCTQAAVEM